MNSSFLNNNFLSKKVSKKKNLLILTGHLRSAKHILEYHKKFIELTNSDVLLTIWSEDIDDIQDVIKVLDPICVDIEEYNFDLTTKIFGIKNKYDNMFGSSAESTRSQIYKIIRGVELLKKIEKVQNKKYEIVFKSRPDFLFLSNLNLSIGQQNLIFENTVGNWAIDRSDRFFYARRNLFVEFVETFAPEVKEAWHEDAIHQVFSKVPLQEMLIKRFVDKGNFKSNPFFPFAIIWRNDYKPRTKDKLSLMLYTLRRIFKRRILKRKT
tara:strand:+ start:266 stop:1066 length:801 start_codon:yes stop_codon:yes gene_type:complete